MRFRRGKLRRGRAGELIAWKYDAGPDLYSFLPEPLLRRNVIAIVSGYSWQGRKSSVRFGGCGNAVYHAANGEVGLNVISLSQVNTVMAADGVLGNGQIRISTLWRASHLPCRSAWLLLLSARWPNEFFAFLQSLHK